MLRRHFFASVILLGVTANLGPCQLNTSLQDLAKVYRDLSRRVYTTWDDPESEQQLELIPSKRQEQLARMHQLIRDQIGAAISEANRQTNDELLRERIKAIQSLSFGTLTAESTNTPFVVPFLIDGREGYCASYLILKGAAAIPDSDVYLECYEARDGHLSVTVGESTDLNQRTLFLYHVPRQIAGEERFLVWGNRLGDTGARLSARLYSFNGREFRITWRRDDLTFGELKIVNGTVELSYDPAYRSPQRDFKHERLLFTPQGLQ